MGLSYRVPPALTVALWLLPSPALSQALADEDDLSRAYGETATISLATGSPQALRRAPAVATVITAEDIERMGATDLDQVMETVPGVHVSRDAIVFSPLYVIRGIFSQFTPQTLMLQNGVPMTTMFFGTKGNVWGGFPVSHIARIEIIRGPGSALYGADAYAGVINIITKNAADIQGTQLGARVASFDTRDGWLQHGGKLGPVDVAVYVRVGHTDGFQATASRDAQSFNDTVFGTQVSRAPGRVNLGYDAVDANIDLGYEKWRLRAGYMQRDNVGTGMGVASALDPAGKGQSERITADLSWTDPHLAKDWGMGLTASHLHYADTTETGFVLFPAGTTFPTGTFPDGMIGAPEKWERQLRLSAFANYAGFARHQLRLGLGHDDLDLYRIRELKNFTFSSTGLPVPIAGMTDFSSTTPFIFPQRRKVTYAYLQDEWTFAKDWAITGGVRHDRFSDVGSTTNPRLALVWDVSLDLTAKLLYGQAFRAPAFHELYSINNPVVRGNPDLRPETIRTWEAAFSWQARRDLLAQLSLFQYAMKDIIRAVPNDTPGTGARTQNRGRQKGTGMELDLAWTINRNLRAVGNYAYQRSVDQTTGQDAGYAPHHHVYARGEWDFSPGWLLTPQLNWVADRRRAAGDTRAPVPDYATLDLALRTRGGTSDWHFSASVLNLFNADVREPSLAPGLAIPDDLPMARRSFSLQAVYAM